MSTEVKTQSESYQIVKHWKDGQESVSVGSSLESITLTKEDAIKLAEDLQAFILEE